MKILRKLIIFIIIVFDQIYGDSNFQITLDNHDYECIKELQLKKNEIVNGFDTNFKVEEGNPVLTKFMNCAWRKAGHITENNHINVTSLRKWLTQWDLRDLHAEYEVNNVESLVTLVDECLVKCIVNEFLHQGDVAVKTYNCLLDCLLWKRLS